MTKEEFAKLLDGRRYGNEITEREETVAKGSGLLVIFGYSDDGVYLKGVIDDELGAFGGTTLAISPGGKLVPEVDCGEDMDVLKKYGALAAVEENYAMAHKIKAVWCAATDYCWTFETEVPHAVFDILEGKDKFCRGIVIDMKDMQKKA